MLPVCHPGSDAAFAARVRTVIDRDRWDMGSAEGVAAFQAVLRATYPEVTVVAQGEIRAGGVRRTVVLDVYRGGAASTEPDVRWLGAVYDLCGAAVYRVAARILGDGPRAEQVVERAFANAWHARGGVSVEDGATVAEAAVRRLVVEARTDDTPTTPSDTDDVDVATPGQIALRIGSVRRALSGPVLARLGAAPRAAVELAVLEGLKVREIAERMQTSQAVVARYLKEALLAAGSNVTPSAPMTLERWRAAQREWSELPTGHPEKPQRRREVAYAWLDCQLATSAVPEGTIVLVTDADRRFVATSPTAGAMLGRPSVVGLRIDDITADYARPMVDGLWTIFDENGSMDGDYDCDRPGQEPIRVGFRGVWGRPLPDLQVGYLRPRD